MIPMEFKGRKIFQKVHVYVNLAQKKQFWKLMQLIIWELPTYQDEEIPIPRIYQEKEV